ncbi:hypothetical protein [Leptotrichia alba]|uniref:Uncharacterized protein n=1 Tax=Leptotrichia alba TaxID=3239304 RepID=A0AB39V2Y6_9FUSO
MKKILLMAIMLIMSTIGLAANKVINQTYEGDYIRSTNTFVYEKDNLVFPNKVLNYTVKDDTGLMDQIYNFIGQKYGVTDEDSVVFNIQGTVSKDNVLTVKKIINYRIPEHRLHPSDTSTTSVPSTDTESSSQQEDTEITNDSDSSN